MQIVGQECNACGKPIVAEASARWCARCRLAFHDGCTEEAAACPQCRVPFAVTAEEERKLEASEVQRDLTAGRRLLLLCFALLILPNLLNIAVLAAFRAKEGADLVRAIANAIASVLLFWLVYAGVRGAKTLLQVGLVASSGFLTIGWLSLASRAAKVSPEALAVLGSIALLIGIQLAVLGILAISRRIRWFLESQAPRRD